VRLQLQLPAAPTLIVQEAAKQAEEEKRLREEEERQRLRKAAEFHALPMPDLSAPPPPKQLPPKQLTKPVSPVLGRRKRRKALKQARVEEDD
jgi:targeting protein for Xklp2